MARVNRAAEDCFLRGMEAARGGQPGAALGLIRQAIAHDPARAEYHAQLARCLALLHDLSAALAAAERVLTLPDADGLALDTAGVVLSRGHEHRRAAEAFRRAVARAPDNAGYRFNLASSLKFLGRFAEAEQAYRDCLRLRPDFWKAWPALTGIRSQTPADMAAGQMRELLAGAAGDPEAELQLNMALGKTCEDLGDHAAAFRHFTAGKAARRRRHAYRPEDDAAIFRTIERLFDQPLPPPAASAPVARPLFIVGMPRTGTTLVERILASHSRVRAGGELNHFPLLLKRASGVRTPRVLDPETLEQAASAVDSAALGRDYLAATDAIAGNAAHLTDKLPLNFLYAGFIARALPGARIICLRRDPLDTCVANFRQLFAQQFAYYEYSWDLLDTGRYFLLFDRLLRHWREVLPGRLLELEYERIVHDPESESRRLLAFCGLDWEEACLAFSKNPDPVATASAVQVRSPLYHRSIGRWRDYAPWLGPLRQLLAEGGLTKAQEA